MCNYLDYFEIGRYFPGRGKVILNHGEVRTFWLSA